MKLITSLAPKNIEAQTEAIKTWGYKQFDVYSINAWDEIDRLYGMFDDVTYIPAKETARELYGEKIPYPNLLEMLDFCFSQTEPVWIVNSDIMIKTPGIIGHIHTIHEKAKEVGLVFGNRVDMYEDPNFDEVYFNGFDWFCIDPSFSHLFTTRKRFCIGQPFWDYWLPLTFIRKGVTPWLCKNKIAYHRVHTTNWDNKQLNHYGYMLGKEMGIHLQEQDIGHFTYFCNTTIEGKSEKWNIN